MRAQSQMEARVRCAGLAAALALGAVLLPMAGGGAAAAYAQNFGQRVVIGVVQNSEGAVLPGATVFLRSEKNKTIRSFTTAVDGHFRFVQVNMSEDFDLWAEKDGRKSVAKTVSSWDTRKEASYELKIK